MNRKEPIIVEVPNLGFAVVNEYSLYSYSVDYQYPSITLRGEIMPEFAVKKYLLPSNIMHGYFSCSTVMNSLRELSFQKIISSGPCTIVLWSEGDKTIVRLRKGNKNNMKTAILWAMGKRLYGSRHQLDKVVKQEMKAMDTKSENKALATILMVRLGFTPTEFNEYVKTFVDAIEFH